MQIDIPDGLPWGPAGHEALAQLRRLSLNQQDSLEAERLRVSREVHDQLGAALTGMRMKLEHLAARVQGGVPVPATELLALADTARATQLAAREICTRLRPHMLDDMGLSEACRWYLKDWAAQVGMAARGRFARLVPEPAGPVATDLFRVMQELLTNVAQHAGATRVSVALSGGPEGLRLRVKDDGHGFLLERATPGFGVMGMRERVRHHGGSLELRSGASGTTAIVRMLHLAVP